MLNQKAYELLVNMHGEEGVTSGSHTDYLQPIPLRGTGFHRYVYVLLEHSTEIESSLLPVSIRKHNIKYLILGRNCPSLDVRPQSQFRSRQFVCCWSQGQLDFTKRLTCISSLKQCLLC